MELFFSEAPKTLTKAKKPEYKSQIPKQQKKTFASFDPPAGPDKEKKEQAYKEHERGYVKET